MRQVQWTWARGKTSRDLPECIAEVGDCPQEDGHLHVQHNFCKPCELCTPYSFAALSLQHIQTDEILWITTID